MKFFEYSIRSKPTINRKLLKLLLAAPLLMSNLVAAREFPDPDKTLMVDKTSFFSIGLSRNFPTSPGLDRFSTGLPHPVLSYRYLHDDRWLMSIGGGYKIFRDLQENANLAFFSVFEDIAYLHRLHYPHFVSLGARIYYLNPVDRAALPMTRYRDFAPDIGAGFNLSYLGMVNSKDFIECRLERWRGTKSMNFHAWETVFSYSFGF